MQDSISKDTSLASKLRGFGGYIVAGLALLIPLFFIPNAVFPFQFSKIALVLLGVAVIVFLFSIDTLRKGTLSFLWSKFMLALLALPLAYAVASIFSPVPLVSFFGYQLDQDTFGFITLAVSLSFAVSLVVTSEKRIFSALLGFLISGSIVAAFQLIQLFFGAPIMPTLFTSTTANTVGTWNDLALFMATVASLVLLALETFTLSLVGAVVLSIVLLASLAILVLANFSLAWWLVGGVAFATLLFAFMQRQKAQVSSVLPTRAIASCLILVIAAFFIFFGAGISTGLQTHFHVQAFDVRPSIEGTLGVLQHVYQKNAFLGAGPNMFSNAWFLYRSPEIAATQFWNVGFTAGFGTIPTAFVTGGIVVGLAWLLFIAMFLYVAIRALLTVPASDTRSYFLIAATSLASFLLIVAHIFYVPSQALTLLLFLFIGLLVASLRETELARPVSIVFSESPRLGFLSVLAVAIMLVVSLTSLYGAGKVYAGSVEEGNAIVKSNANDLEGSYASAMRAAALLPQDRHYRTLTTLSLARLGVLVGKGGTDKAAQDAFRAGLADAINASASAVSANPFSFENMMSRASVYEAVVPLNIDGAFEKALETLQSAALLNPTSPEVDYHIANLKAYKKDFAGARAFAESALKKKADYTPAILLIAQLSLNEGKIDDAIAAVNAAVVFTPKDSSLLYQLGLLHLQAGHYQKAADAFEAALVITPDYANASFFLGQADVFLDKKDTALTLFKGLESKNPDNATLKAVIAALEKGENPFAQGTIPPTEKTPESI